MFLDNPVVRVMINLEFRYNTVLKIQVIRIVLDNEWSICQSFSCFILCYTAKFRIGSCIILVVLTDVPFTSLPKLFLLHCNNGIITVNCE